jgi:hypothetical protein
MVVTTCKTCCLVLLQVGCPPGPHQLGEDPQRSGGPQEGQGGAVRGAPAPAGMRGGWARFCLAVQ